MKRSGTVVSGIFALLGMFILILDGKTAFEGAKEGVVLCLNSLIPSLFPFLVLSIIINSLFIGKQVPFLRPIGKLCGIPKGAESILLLSLLGGYPVGAQSIADAYQRGYLPKTTAQRLLGFCNNAGPSFIFGIIALQFTTPYIAWFIWFIHIFSAIIVGMLLPKSDNVVCKLTSSNPTTFPKALDTGMKILAKICGWVILFRVFISVLRRWLFWLFPLWLQILLTGFIELANGCVALHLIPTEGLRFILAACALALGGICVGMQTLSVTGSLGFGLYFPGKVLQCIISFFIAERLQYFIFSTEEIFYMPPILCFCFLLILIIPLTRIFHPYIKTRTATRARKMLDIT